jgi:hypothetical protein
MVGTQLQSNLVISKGKKQIVKINILIHSG